MSEFTTSICSAIVALQKQYKIVENDEIDPVSYTHLRAHETVLDLVCRLLLEKKKEHKKKKNTQRKKNKKQKEKKIQDNKCINRYTGYKVHLQSTSSQWTLSTYV